MTVQSQQTKKMIELAMKEKLAATYVEIVDESWKHAGHAAAGGGGHFDLLVVSEMFEGISLMNRNRMVFDALNKLMQGEIHALSVKAKTPEEWKRLKS